MSLQYVQLIIEKQNIKIEICENEVFSTLYSHSFYFLPDNGKGDGYTKPFLKDLKWKKFTLLAVMQGI